MAASRAMLGGRVDLPGFATNEWYGALAQLGERYNGIVEVSGSIPLGSTIRTFEGNALIFAFLGTDPLRRLAVPKGSWIR